MHPAISPRPNPARYDGENLLPVRVIVPVTAKDAARATAAIQSALPSPAFLIKIKNRAKPRPAAIARARPLGRPPPSGRDTSQIPANARAKPTQGTTPGNPSCANANTV